MSTLRGVGRRLSRPTRRYGWPVVFLLGALGHALARFNDLTWGHAQLNPDVTRMFLPIARGVASGAPLYGPGLADNKPPGWQLLNVAVYLTGEYTVAMLVAVGLANGAAAILLWRLLGGFDAPGLGVVAAAMFLLVLPLAGGHHVNSRPFMVAFVLAAFLSRRPAIRGAAVAIGTLFNAYGAAFVVALLWLIRREADAPRRAVAEYLAAGALTAAIVFGVVAAVWRPDAVRAALYWSFGLPVAGGVATSAVHHEAVAPDSYLARSWLLTDPLLWIHYTRTLVLQFLPLLALTGVGWLHQRQVLDSPAAVRLLGAGLLAALFPLFFRGYEQYWLPLLPFLAAYAAVGITALVGRATKRESLPRS